MIKNFKQNLINNKWLYISFLCFGLFAGALVVDIQGLGKGKISLDYLSGGLGSMFQTGDKTWVSYNNPIIEMTVINDLQCSYCDASKEIEAIKQNISPTIAANDIDYKSEGGKTLVNLFNIKSLPAFIFSGEIESINNFENIKHLFKKEGNYLMLDPIKVGMDPLKILDMPEDSDAEIVILEISDYQCPYCKKASQTLREVLKDYNEGDIKIIHKHLPLSFHEFAEAAAIGAECARKQDKFKEMNNSLYDSQFNSDKEIKDIAKKIDGIDYNKWERCFNIGETKNIVDGDAEWANSLGISGTPTFIINGRYISGALDYEGFKEIINEELQITN